MPYVDPQITVAEVGCRLSVVTVHGELDFSCAEELRGALDGSKEEGRMLIVDLVGATFVDSTAVGVLAAASRRLELGGGGLTIVTGDPRTLRVLALTGLTRRIAVEHSLADAIADRLAPDAAA